MTATQTVLEYPATGATYAQEGMVGAIEAAAGEAIAILEERHAIRKAKDSLRAFEHMIATL